MSEIKNDGLDQYGAKPFQQQQFGTSGVEGVKAMRDVIWVKHDPKSTNSGCIGSFKIKHEDL